MAYHCPICRRLRPRKDYATCGAPDCVDSWKPLSADQRAKFKELADGYDVPTAATEMTPTETEMTPEMRKLLTPANKDEDLEKAKKSLDSILGKKPKKSDNDKED